MNERTHRIRNTWNVILSVFFAAALTLPALQQRFRILQEMPSTEQRMPAARPAIEWTYLDPFPRKFENYFNDHFSLRNQLIRMKSLIRATVLKQSPLPGRVITGKEGWLYIVKDELATYRGTNRYNSRRLDTLRNELLMRKNWLNLHGMGMYLVVIPTKYSIYPEYLPKIVDRVHSETRTDQVIKALTASGIKVIDLRTTLRKAKGKMPLFYKTDNHWNNPGSLAGYQEIIHIIRQDYPLIPPPARLEDFEMKTEFRKGMNLAHMLSLEDQYSEERIIFQPKEKPKAHRIKIARLPAPPENAVMKDEYEINYATGSDFLPDALVIRDSFSNSLMPLLSEHFNRTTYIFDDWRYRFDPEMISTLQPDLVIFILVESLWDDFMKGFISEEPDP